MQENEQFAAIYNLPYREREVLMGHCDLIPSMRPIVGGVALDCITRCFLNTGLHTLVFLSDISPKLLTTATLYEDGDGQLHRILQPSWATTLANVKSFLCTDVEHLSSVAASALSRQLELRAAGADSGLACLKVIYAAFPLRLLLALDVADGKLKWYGDRQLTLQTYHKSFDSKELAKNLGV